MKGRRLAGLALMVPVLAFSGCKDKAPEPVVSVPTESNPSAVPGPTSEAPSPSPVASPDVTDLPPVPLDAALVRKEWHKAENRAACAPLAFTSLGGAAATARPANFAGGWAIAYDQPGLRSAFGLAGAGLIDADNAPPPDQRARLARQWPLFGDLENLPWPAFAGYGVEGGDRYPPDNPEGKGLNSLAYLRVGEQTCTYNVWSRLGRAHLEHLLERLTLVEP